MPPFPASRRDRSSLFAAPPRESVNLLTGKPLNSFLQREKETGGTARDAGLDAETRQTNGRLARRIAQQDSFDDLLPILDRALQENPRQAGLEIEDLVAQLTEQSPEQARQLTQALPRFGTAGQGGFPPLPEQRPRKTFVPPPQAAAGNSAAPPIRKGDAIDFPLVQIPNYKKSLPGVTNHWDDFKAAVERFPGMTPGIRRAFLETFAAEGGLAPDGQAMAGITPEALDEVRDELKLDAGVMPRDLTNEQRVQVYWAFMNQPHYLKGGFGGLRNLEDLDDHEAAAALFDTLFRHGSGKGARIVQHAMNRLLPEPIDEDGAFGSESAAAYKVLIKDPETRLRLLINIGKGRYDDKPREKSRAIRFMFLPPRVEPPF